MKILVLSDSHGDGDSIEQAFDREKPDEVIFLGDGIRDIEFFSYTFPKAYVSSVRGNCDFFSRINDEFTASFDGVNVFACHGHTYNVKSGVSYLAYTSKRRNSSLALYGHTHEPYCEIIDGVTVFNPGSIRNGRYGIISIKDGSFECLLKEL